MLSNLPLSLVNYSNLAVSPSPLSSLLSSPLSSPSSSSCKLGSYLLLLIMAALLLPRATGHPLPDAGAPRKTGFDQSDNFHIDFPQGDEAPRPGGVTHSLPKDWRLQPQERYYYLRAKNDQYLQIKNDTITGTYSAGKLSIYGILQFISHNNSLLIASAYSQQLLCMNKETKLYLVHRKEFNDNKECYIHESNNDPEGSASATYEFTLYYRTRHRHLYLGIDCQPLLGSETNSTEKTARFITEPANKTLIRQLPEPEGQTTQCIPQKEIDRMLRLKKEKKFKAKVCRNLNRLAKNVTGSLMKCKRKCAQTKNCMCPILERMLNSPNATQIECLVSKIKKWVLKQLKASNSTEKPNMRVIKRVARRLLPGYSRIARRMRSEWKKKNSLPTTTNKPTNKPRRVIKINKLLSNDRYKAELLDSKPNKLSPDFIKAIKALLDTKSERRHRQRKSKNHKRRHHRNKNRSRRRKQLLAHKELPARPERDARHPHLSAPPG